MKMLTRTKHPTPQKAPQVQASLLVTQKTIAVPTLQEALAAKPPKVKDEVAQSINTFQRLGDFLQKELRKHVFGQDPMVFVIIAAVLSGLRVCLTGKSGIGKSHAAETTHQLLGIKGQVLPLHSGVTCSDITGSMVLDLETHKMVYMPSPFLNGNHMVILDELNRSTTKAQNALLDIMNKSRIIIGTIPYPLNEPFTTIMTMNPPGSPGTQDIVSALADRIDYTLWVEPPSPEVTGEIIAYDCLPEKDVQILSSPEKEMFEFMTQGHNGSQNNGSHSDVFDWLARIGEARDVFQYHLANVDETVGKAASWITSGFQGPDWEVEATPRTAIAMVRMATVTALLQGAPKVTPNHVWVAASGCLGMLQSSEWMENHQALLKKIDDRLQAMYTQSLGTSKGM